MQITALPVDLAQGIESVPNSDTNFLMLKTAETHQVNISVHIFNQF